MKGFGKYVIADCERTSKAWQAQFVAKNKKSKSMVLLQNIKVMQRYEVVCERGTIFQWQEYERGILYAKNGI